MLKIFAFSNKVNNNTVLNKANTTFYSNPFSFSVKLNSLSKDEVSFTSRKKFQEKAQLQPQAIVQTSRAGEKDLKDKERTITNGLAHLIYRQADSNTIQLKSVLNKAFYPYIQKRGYCDNKHPILKLEYRTKGASSLREKASSKHIHTKEGVIVNLQDLSGARIILGSNQKGSADVVIDKLAEVVKDGKLKIVEIENHTPADKKYQYASQTKLHKLAKASSDKFGAFVSEHITRNETGYIAIHLTVEFPDGMRGEIQILGRDVAIFKELEDLPYKILQGKSVKPEYAEIVEIFKPLTPVRNNPFDPENIEKAKLRQEFSAYTAAAYKHERDKMPVSSTSKKVSSFLSLDEFSKMSKRKIHLPKEVDFNNLYKLKIKADRLAEK